MRLYNFIFSGKPNHRLLRHGTFWLLFLLYFYYTNLFPSKPEDLRNYTTYSDALRLMIFVPTSFISVYVTIYFILPVYVLRNRYAAVAAAFVILIAITFFISYLLTMLLATLTTTTPFHQLPLTFRWFQPVRYGIGLPLTSAAITGTLKLLKTWHLKQKEVEHLLQRKTRNEIQLLKTQFQPKFLYNTLQEISLLVQKHSAEVPNTLMKLSELLSFLLHEVEKDEVPLGQEIEMVKHFISLKKSFYPKKLTIDFNQQGEADNHFIAPLLLVSLIENFFTALIDPSPAAYHISADIKIDANDLYLSLEAKKKNERNFIPGNDHWYEPSLKKIKLLYPYRHRFETFTENNMIAVTLALETLSEEKVSGKFKKRITGLYEPA